MILKSAMKRMVSPRHRASLRQLIEPTRLERVEREVAWLNRSLAGVLFPSAERTLNDFEFRISSQNGEDGMLLRLFSLIGTQSRTFVEFGAGDASECNTANLFRSWGWGGLLIEGQPELAAVAAGSTPANVVVSQSYVTTESINSTIAAAGFCGEIDLLSIDIDGNDLWLWEAITVIEPRAVIIEYNASFGPDASVSLPYRADVVSGCADDPLYFGASLAALERVGRRKGMRLVGCDSTGVNALFVRDASGPPTLTAAEAWRPSLRWAQVYTQEEQERRLASTVLVEVH